MDLAKKRLRRFNEQSQPAFQQWLCSTFGREITELRELAQKFQELRRIVFEVEEYKFFARCSYHEAYQAVMEGRARPESFDQETEQDENPFGDFGGFDDRRDPEFSGFDETVNGRSDSKQDSSSEESRLKTLYRALARKLHPDVNLELDQKRKDLWQQVQDAYETKDVERLETLSAMNEISWDFEKTREQPKKLKRIHEQIKIQMMFDKTELLDCIELGEKKLEKWKRPPSSRNSRQKAKSRNSSFRKGA